MAGHARAEGVEDWRKTLLQIESGTLAGVSHKQYAQLFADSNTVYELTKEKNGMAVSRVIGGILLLSMNGVNSAWGACDNVAATDGNWGEHHLALKNGQVGKVLIGINELLNLGAETINKSLSAYIEKPISKLSLLPVHGDHPELISCDEAIPHFLSAISEQAQAARFTIGK